MSEELHAKKMESKGYQYQVSLEKPLGTVHWMVWHYNAPHKVHIWRYVSGVFRGGVWYRNLALSKYLKDL